jgi:hypothetical protein
MWNAGVMRLMQRKQCQALAETTQARCKNSALRFSKYCLLHESKASHFISLFLGGIIILLLTQAWHWVFTTKESPQLQALQKATDKNPSFRILMNGVAVADLSQVQIPYTDNAVIKIRVQNSGSASASEISACIIYPAYFTQVSPDGWDQQLSSDWYEHEQIMPEIEVAHHRVISRSPLTVGDGLSLPDIQIKNPKNSLIPVVLRVWAPNSEVSITRFNLIFTEK